jgi:uncharacterized phage-associated protein
MIRAQQKVSAMQVAQYFIDRANRDGKPITNKKLQKLVYYAQVWSLVLNKERLLPDRIEAWVHGPAVPSLYRRFKSFEANPIVLDTSGVDFQFDAKQRHVLESIWSIYGKYEASYLEALTHSEAPWQQARKDLPLSQASSNVIDLKTAQEFYAAKLRANRNK